MLIPMLQMMGLAFAKPLVAPLSALDPAKSPKTSSRGIKHVAMKSRTVVASPQTGLARSSAHEASLAHDEVISAGRQQVKAALKRTNAPAKASKPLAKPAISAKAKAAKAKDKKPAAKAKPLKKALVPVTPAKPAKLAKPAAKPATKKMAKPAKKALIPAAAKKPVASSAKTSAKSAAKSNAKLMPKAVAKKVAPKLAAKPAKPAKPTTTKPVARQGAAVKVTAGKPASAAISSNTSHLKTGSTLANVLPPLSPPTKARSSRMASLTVPSMAQAVASTAAKSSYSQLPAPVVLMPLPQAAQVKNPKLANNWKTKPVDKLTDEDVLAMPDAQYMNEAQMAFFRLKLLQLKTDILNSAGETTEHLREETVVVPDPADRATIEEEHALELRTRDRERKLLKKIEQSIGLIDSGDYGYCDETGEPIGVGRLLARPTATLSLEAQQRRELRQKMFGD